MSLWNTNNDPQAAMPTTPMQMQPTMTPPPGGFWNGPGSPTPMSTYLQPIMPQQQNNVNGMPMPSQSTQQPIMHQQWTYIDASGVVQGPFEEHQLVAWMQSGHFCNRTLAKRTSNDIYRSLVVHGFAVNQNDLEARESEAWRYKDWYYMDSNNIMQGPYDLQKMRMWSAEYFDENTMVCCGATGTGNDNFQPLGNTVIGYQVDDSSVLLPQQSPPSSSVASNAAAVLPSSGVGGAATTTDGGAPLVVSNTQSTMNLSNMVGGTGVMNEEKRMAALGLVPVSDVPGLSMLAAGSSNSQDVIRSLQDDLQSMKIALRGSFLNDCF